MARSYKRTAEAGPAENPYLINSISPGRLQFNDTWGVSDDVYFRPMVVNKFREQQALGWCDGFVASDELRAPVAIVCRPASSGKLAEQINRSIAMAESTYGEGMMSYTDIMKKRREAAHANEMAALLVEDNAKMFDTVCYVILRSTGREKLDEMEDYLKSSLSHYGNGAVHQIFNTKEAFLGASPLLADDWYSLKTSSVPLPAITIAWGLPTGTSGLDHLVGVEIGKDDRGGIVRLNCTEHTEELPNGNIFLSGETGSGKSTTGKKIVATEHVVLGTKVIVPNDPEGEWGRLALSCGGEVSRVGVDSKFSPFEPRNIGVIGEDGEEIDAESSGKELVLASTLPFLMTFLKMAYRIPDDLIDYLDAALESLYGDYGIYPETTFADYRRRGLSYPIMVELYDKLLDMAEALPDFSAEFERLALTIRPAAIGRDRALWNSRTSFSPSTDFIVIDTQGLSADKDIMRAQYYNILTWTWSECKSGRFSDQYLRIVCDELHTIMNKQSLEAAYQIKNIVQRIRKYGGGMMCITPQVIDMMDESIESAGRSVVYNSAYRFFGKATDDAPGGNLWHVKQLLGIPDEVAAKLASARRGKMIVQAGAEKSWVNVTLKDWELEMFGKGGGK